MIRRIAEYVSGRAGPRSVRQIASGGRGVPHWVRTQSAHQWSTQRDAQAPRDLDGNHALVIGTGPIGQAIARSCRALGLRVTGVRRLS